MSQMRYGFFSDIHGMWNNASLVLKQMERYGVDQYLCLGDLFEVKISKRELLDFVFKDVEQVVDLDERLIQIMRDIPTIIGNQEERLLELLPQGSLPQEIHSLFTGLPKEILLSDHAMVHHGHHWLWQNYDEEYYYPIVDEWKRPRMFYGHNHQNALFQWDSEHSGEQGSGSGLRFIPIRNREPIHLSQKQRYLINVGDCKQSHPNWVLYDEGQDELIYYTIKN